MRDGEQWWTLDRYNGQEPQPTSKQLSAITTIQPTTSENRWGGDELVNPHTGDRANAFIVHHNSMKYSEARRFKATPDATLYGAELEANKGVQDIAEELQLATLIHT